MCYRQAIGFDTEGSFSRAIIGQLFLTCVCLSLFDPTADNDEFYCKYCKGFLTASRFPFLGGGQYTCESGNG